MYYEEKIINCRWHYRTSPTAEWLLFTASKLEHKLNVALFDLAAVTKERDELKFIMSPGLGN